jgi:AAA domain-containing protein/DnaB helicase-like protein
MSKNKWDNPRAERALLGGLLDTPEWIGAWVDKLWPTDFYEPAREWWWRALVYTHQQGVPGDRAMMRQFWADNDKLALIAEQEPSGPLDDAYEGIGPARIKHYAQIVFDNSMSRMESAILMQMAQQVITRAEGERKLSELDARRAHFTGDAAPDGAPLPETYRMHEMMGEQLPPVRWVVTDLFPEGVTLLAAKPKKGKTTLMMHIAAAVAGGSKACGHFDTEQCEVLYLALEDNKRRMQKRMRQMMQGEPVPKGVHVVHQWRRLDLGGLDDLERYLDQHSAIHKIVVDTLEHIRPKRRSQTGSYADDYEAVRDLQQLAGRRQVAIVPIVHLRKAPADDPFDEINATTGLMASVDNAIVLRPNSGIMEMHRRGRDYEDDTVLALKGDAKTLLWKVEGDARDVTRSAARKAIIDVLPAADADKGMQPIQIAEWLPNATRGAIRKLLHEMMQEKEPPIISDGNGGYKKAAVKKPGNSGNSGNGNDGKADESAPAPDSSQDKPVTRPVTLLPMPNNSGNSGENGRKPDGERPPVGPVTGVTPVTANSNGAVPVCMKCRAPKRPLPGGGYELTCACGGQQHEGQVPA